VTRVFWIGRIVRAPRAPDGFAFRVRVPGGPRPGEEAKPVVGEVHLCRADEPVRPFLAQNAWIDLKGIVELRRWQPEGDPGYQQVWFVRSREIIPIAPPLLGVGRNFASLAGRLASDVRPCSGGCEFELRVNFISHGQRRPMWIPTTIYGEIAEKAKRQLIKGRAVTVEGALHFGYGAISHQPKLTLRGTDFWPGSAYYDNLDEAVEPERCNGDEGGGLAPY